MNCYINFRFIGPFQTTVLSFDSEALCHFDRGVAGWRNPFSCNRYYGFLVSANAPLEMTEKGQYSPTNRNLTRRNM